MLQLEHGSNKTDTKRGKFCSYLVVTVFLFELLGNYRRTLSRENNTISCYIAMPFQKGHDPNRHTGGRPEGSISVVSALKRELKKMPDESKKTNLELLVARIVKLGVSEGDVRMIKDIIDRVDGKAKESVDLTSGGEKIVPIYGGISKHSSDGEDIQSEEADTGD